MSAAQQKPTPAGVDMTEIRQLVRDVLPPLAETSAGGEALGAYTDAWRWLAAAQGNPRPALRHPRLALFAAAYALPRGRQPDMAAVLKALSSGTHALARIAAEANADLQVYELSAETPGENAALTLAEAAHAFSYGLMAVQPGIDLLALAALNPASDAAAEILRAELKKGAEPLEALAASGGLDICAIAGAITAARLARAPVLLDGKAAGAAAEALAALRPDAVAHCRRADSLLARPAPDAPGLGAALLLPLLKAIAAC